MVDFQGVCLQRSLRLEKSSGGLFRGVRSKISFKFNFHQIYFFVFLRFFKQFLS
jgi:hypothetical protein